MFMLVLNNILRVLSVLPLGNLLMIGLACFVVP